jgi:pyruvate kinase
MRRAKIVATIGPASESEERLRELMLAGMDVARINMSHGEREHHGEIIARIRSVADELNRPVAVMLDLSGPKIRTGKMRDGEAHLREGSEVRLVSAYGYDASRQAPSLERTTSSTSPVSVRIL